MVWKCRDRGFESYSPSECLFCRFAVSIIGRGCEDLGVSKDHVVHDLSELQVVVPDKGHIQDPQRVRYRRVSKY